MEVTKCLKPSGTHAQPPPLCVGIAAWISLTRRMHSRWSETTIEGCHVAAQLTHI